MKAYTSLIVLAALMGLSSQQDATQAAVATPVAEPIASPAPEAAPAVAADPTPATPASTATPELKAIDTKEAAALVADPTVDANGVADTSVVAPKHDHSVQFQEMTPEQWNLYDAETQLQKYREMKYSRKSLIDEASKLEVKKQLIDQQMKKVEKDTTEQVNELTKIKQQMADKAKVDAKKQIERSSDKDNSTKAKK